MSERPDPIDARNPAEQQRFLTLVHRAALFVLACSAAIVAGYPTATTTDPPPSVYLFSALGLGILAIGFRQAASGSSRSPDSRTRLAAIAYASAAAIGVVGIALAAIEGQRQAGLLYAAGGAILALRSPAALVAQKR